MNTKNVFEFSAGGVVKEKSRVLLIKTPPKAQPGVWTFPKGKIEKGEGPSEAALREVLEETGYRCGIEKKLGDTRYFFRHKDLLVNKKVIWFLMSPSEREGPPEREIKKVRWFKHPEAQRLLKYASDKELLKKVFPSLK